MMALVSCIWSWVMVVEWPLRVTLKGDISWWIGLEYKEIIYKDIQVMDNIEIDLKVAQNVILNIFFFKCNAEIYNK